MEIQKLQEQISSTVSEGASNEQAITKQNEELPTENQWIQEQWKEWKQKEKTMRIQLKNSEGRPYVPENLGEIQSLKELVKQQTLQKGFQDGLCDISEFCAKEQERLQKTYGILKQTYEKEEEIQSQKVMDAEEKPVQPEDIQLMERPQKDMTAANSKNVGREKYGTERGQRDTCKQNIWCHLGDKTDSNKDHFSNLLEMKSGLVDASHCLEQVEIFLQQQLKELRETEDHICCNSADGIVPLQEQFLLTREKEFSQLLKISDENKLKLFADKLVFEAQVLEKMSQALLNKDSDIVQSLESLSKEAEILSSDFPALNMVREPSSPAHFADILLRKTISDGEFWIEVEKLTKNIQPEETAEEKRVDGDAGFINEFVTGAADNALLKAELAFTVQKIQETFRAKVGKLEDDIRDALQEIAYKDNMLREVLIASKTDEVNKVMQQLFGQCENPTVPEGKNSDCDGADGLCDTIEVGRNLQHVEKQAELESMTVLHDRIHELEAQMDMMRDELGQKHKAGTIADLRETYQRDLDKLKETCERGFTAMEESHQKVIEELQKQHQNELEELQKEKDRLLAEETAATIAAIEAMKNAHREELERELEKTHRSQISGMNADIEALGRQHKEEMGSVQRELQVLSEQYSHKCLENSHLAQALEAERQALRQCQRENQEINARNQELNNRLAAEFARLRALVTEEGKGEDAGSPLSLGKDVYELEVLLRVKESEIQYLKQEINSLKDELQIALRDKKYATDKYKSIYTELSIVRAKADCDVNRLKEQLKTATEALGEKTIDCCVTSY
eukprot:g47731.t1